MENIWLTTELSDANLFILSPFLSRLVYVTCKFKDVVIQLSVIISSLWSSTSPHPHKTLKLHERLDPSLESHTHTHTHTTYKLLLVAVGLPPLSFSHSVVSDSLQPHGLQYARLSCPSLCPGVCSDSCALNQWWHPTISSCFIPFSSCLQSFPASGSFLISQFFTSGGQSLGASPSASVLPMNIQGWFPLELTDFISLQSKGLSRVFSNTTVQKHQFFGTQPSFWFNSHIHTWLQEKP